MIVETWVTTPQAPGVVHPVVIHGFRVDYRFDSAGYRFLKGMATGARGGVNQDQRLVNGERPLQVITPLHCVWLRYLQGRGGCYRNCQLKRSPRCFMTPAGRLRTGAAAGRSDQRQELLTNPEDCHGPDPRISAESAVLSRTGRHCSSEAIKWDVRGSGY